MDCTLDQHVHNATRGAMRFLPTSNKSFPSIPRRLPKYSDPRNLVPVLHLPHTRLTYHRTWETGLETEIRVADFSPAFFASTATLCLRVFPRIPLCPPWFKLFSTPATEPGRINTRTFEAALNLSDSVVGI
jgi:hypothetical protein